MNTYAKVCLRNLIRNDYPSKTISVLRKNTVEKIFARLCHHLPKLSATPIVSLFDVAPIIKVEGLKKGSPVTLVAEIVDDKGKKLMSNAHYVADENGEVNTKYDASVGGSYKGIFQTGLISTLKVADGSFTYGRVEKKNLEVPMKVKIMVQDGHEPLADHKTFLDSLVLERLYMGPGVKKIPLKSGRIRGTLYLPKGEGPYPGIIDLFGATGSFIETRAALNASRGIASMALAYFKYDDIPEEKIYDLDLDYFEEAVEYLTSRPGVIPDRCGVIGSCFGGFLAHCMIAHFDKVKAFFGINFSMNSFCNLSYKGNLICKVNNNFSFSINSMMTHMGDGIYAPKEDYLISPPEADESNAQLIKNVPNKHFDFVHGESDVYKFVNEARKVIKLLSEKQKKNVTLYTCPKAGHVIDAPYGRVIDKSFMKMWSKETESPGIIHYWGGEPYSDVQMQEYVWEKSFKFFNLHIRDGSPWYQKYLTDQSRVSEEVSLAN